MNRRAVESLRWISAILMCLCASISAWSAQPTHGVEQASNAISAMNSMCDSDKSCKKVSILPVSNRTGDSAMCVQTREGHYAYSTSTPQKIYLHQHFNGCSHSVRAFMKSNNRWSSAVGTLLPGVDVVLELVYDAADGMDASVVMFCKRGEPKDDVSCQ